MSNTERSEILSAIRHDIGNVLTTTSMANALAVRQLQAIDKMTEKSQQLLISNFEQAKRDLLFAQFYLDSLPFNFMLPSQIIMKPTQLSTLLANAQQQFNALVVEPKRVEIDGDWELTINAHQSLLTTIVVRFLMLAQHYECASCCVSQKEVITVCLRCEHGTAIMPSDINQLANPLFASGAMKMALNLSPCYNYAIASNGTFMVDVSDESMTLVLTLSRE